MPYVVTAALKSGEILQQEFPDRETLDAELRCIQRWRKAGLDLPTICGWTDSDGKKWVLSAADLAGPMEIQEVDPAVAVAVAG